MQKKKKKSILKKKTWWIKNMKKKFEKIWKKNLWENEIIRFVISAV